MPGGGLLAARSGRAHPRGRRSSPPPGARMWGVYHGTASSPCTTLCIVIEFTILYHYFAIKVLKECRNCVEDLWGTWIFAAVRACLVQVSLSITFSIPLFVLTIKIFSKHRVKSQSAKYILAKLFDRPGVNLWTVFDVTRNSENLLFFTRITMES